jgi:hypothetical protein
MPTVARRRGTALFTGARRDRSPTSLEFSRDISEQTYRKSDTSDNPGVRISAREGGGPYAAGCNP